MKIINIYFRYNSYLAFECSVSLSVDRNLVRYKSNTKDGIFQDYESVFLRHPHDVKFFVDYCNGILNWNDYYDVGIMIDGEYWDLLLDFDDGSIRKYQGENGKPDYFDDFVSTFETLIGKPISFLPK